MAKRRFSVGMRFLPPARLAAAGAAAAGVTLLGASLGGMAHVDGELAAAVPPPAAAPAPVPTDRVAWRGRRVLYDADGQVVGVVELRHHHHARS